MLSNWWHKKEMPFQGLIGFGGGATSLGVGGAKATAPGITATGGIIHDYTTPPGTIYRIHTFTNPGNFAVTALSQNPTCPDNIDYLIIGGGGGGANSSNNPDQGYEGAGGGGGGFIRQGISSTKPVAVSPGQYAVTVGHGGPAYVKSVGTPSTFYGKTAPGGGGGGGAANPPFNGNTGASGYEGASGGGGGYAPNDYTDDGGNGTGDDCPSPVASDGDATDSPDNSWGRPGAAGDQSPNRGGGGGGAGAAGTTNPTNGGAGLPSAITGPPTSNSGPTPNPDPNIHPGPAGYCGGGGGNSSWTSNPGSGGAGGGGGGPWPGYPNFTDAEERGVPGRMFSGGGGAGGAGPSRMGGMGGPGIVVVRYQIAEIGNAPGKAASASGGSISFYNSKVIHAFYSPGTFTTDAGFNKTAEYVVLGGGGGGSYNGGGGGAGQYLTSTTPINTPTATAIYVTVGDGGYSSGLGKPNNQYACPGTFRIGAPGFESKVTFPAGTITAAGGGAGMWSNPPANGLAGGSGGGGAGEGQGGSGGSATPGPGGNPGGDGGGSTPQGSGGGGGAGGAGKDFGNDPSSNPQPSATGGDGGLGVQLPATFRDPAQKYGFPGPGPSLWWVAGGGGGGGYQNNGGKGGGDSDTYNASGVNGVGWCGAGDGGSNPVIPGRGMEAAMSSGSGGGSGSAGTGGGGARGGSGLVLIAYPQ